MANVGSFMANERKAILVDHTRQEGHVVRFCSVSSHFLLQADV